MEALIRQLLVGLGEDPDREGLVKTPLRVTKAISTWQGQSLELSLDVFNFLNLLNSSWGQQPLPPLGGGSVPLLTHVGQTSGALTGANGSQGVFTFDPATEKYDRRHLGSAYQMQFGVRYAF